MCRPFRQRECLIALEFVKRPVSVVSTPKRSISPHLRTALHLRCHLGSLNSMSVFDSRGRG